jgi:hypothetical protein
MMALIASQVIEALYPTGQSCAGTIRRYEGYQKLCIASHSYQCRRSAGRTLLAVAPDTFRSEFSEVCFSLFSLAIGFSITIASARGGNVFFWLRQVESKMEPVQQGDASNNSGPFF